MPLGLARPAVERVASGSPKRSSNDQSASASVSAIVESAQDGRYVLRPDHA